jgi:hypothetical protein
MDGEKELGTLPDLVKELSCCADTDVSTTGSDYKSVSDTIYNLPESMPLKEKDEIVASAILHGITATERKNRPVQTKNAATKKIARKALPVIDNLDSLFGSVEKFLWTLLGSLIVGKQWGVAATVCIVVVLIWSIKIRLTEGPVMSFFRSDLTSIKLKLRDASRTIYRG